MCHLTAYLDGRRLDPIRQEGRAKENGAVEAFSAPALTLMNTGIDKVNTGIDRVRKLFYDLYAAHDVYRF